MVLVAVVVVLLYIAGNQLWSYQESHLPNHIIPRQGSPDIRSG